MSYSINAKEAQIAWAAAGYYTGGIDGDIGPLSRKAQAAAQHAGQATYTTPPTRMSVKRRFVASVQWSLNKTGFEAGAVDGYIGHNTRNAMDGLLYKLVNGTAEIVPRAPIMSPRPMPTAGLPSQKDAARFYGDPNDGEVAMRRRMVTIELPFYLRIDYSLRQSTKRMTVHEKCGPSLQASMIAVHEEYGMAEMRRLGLDRYAGGFNYRRMRGGSSWSMHALGCATDFYAQPNGLRTKCPQALFCGAEYTKFLDIMQDHGWLPAIRLWGADAMHFQRATL